MLVKILNAGSGGQGVLTLGNILGNAAMIADYHVTFLPEYGAAMRGGTANCTVCISDQVIASPIASAPDILLAMNQPSVLKFISRLLPGGQMIYNASLVDTVPVRGDLDIFSVAANDIATELGNGRSANMVALGTIVAHLKFLDMEKIHESIDMLMGGKPKLVEISKKALQAGFDNYSAK